MCVVAFFFRVQALRDGFCGFEDWIRRGEVLTLVTLFREMVTVTIEMARRCNVLRR